MIARCRLSKARRKAIRTLITNAHSDGMHCALEINEAQSGRTLARASLVMLMHVSPRSFLALKVRSFHSRLINSVTTLYSP